MQTVLPQKMRRRLCLTLASYMIHFTPIQHLSCDSISCDCMIDTCMIDTQQCVWNSTAGPPAGV